MNSTRESEHGVSGGVFFKAVVLATAVVSASLLPAQAAIFIVNSLSDTDDGACNVAHCSLREAINAANVSGVFDEIRFDAALCGPINIGSPLPHITDPGTQILGDTALECGGGPDIRLHATAGGFPGLVINNVSDCVIRGITFDNFTEGVVIVGNSRNNVIGTSVNRQENFMINNTTGIRLVGIGCEFNTLQNNHIFANTGNGIELTTGAARNTVGGLLPFEKNLASGNGKNGILLEASQGGDVRDNMIIGNICGMGYDGLTTFANGEDGIRLSGPFGDAVYRNHISNNLASGNTDDGVSLDGLAYHNTVGFNWIGMDSSGATTPGNGGHGVFVHSGADTNVVGPDNLISGNTNDGVRIQDSTTEENQVVNNIIGMDLAGTSAFGNGGNGIHLRNQTITNLISGNLVSGNTANGILLADVGTNYNTVCENYVGTDVTGLVGVGNGGTGEGGILLSEGPRYNTVGPDNVASAHDGTDQFGIKLYDDMTIYNTVTDNIVGLMADESDELPNTVGVWIDAPQNDVGPDNVISGNDSWGIDLGEFGTKVFTNWIGTASDGVTVYPNLTGIYLTSGMNEIGGELSLGLGNIISGNDEWGIRAYNNSAASTYSGNIIWGNDVGVDADGNDLGNGSGGIWLGCGFQDNDIGDPGNTDATNTIAYNGGPGVLVGESGCSWDALGNRILTNSIFSNDDLGVDLDPVGYGNSDIPAPTIASATTSGASGSTGLSGGGCPQTTVQVFYDDEGEGRVYLGEQVTTPSDCSWSLSTTIPSGVNVTATNTTDWGGSGYDETSEFSDSVAVGATSVEDPRVTPGIFDVVRRGPNPFHGSTSWRMTLPHDAVVSARVFDVAGRAIRTLLDAAAKGGVHTLTWDGRADGGGRVASGIYLLQVQVGENEVVRRVTLVR